MTDNCFLCLLDCDIKVCHQCNIRSHLKCWEKYIENKYKIDETSILVECPQCRTDIIVERKMISLFIYEKHFIKTIYSFLNQCLDAYSVNEKKIINIDMFSYILNNMEFVNSHPTFKNEIRKKLVFFYKNKGWGYAGDMYEKIFRESI